MNSFVQNWEKIYGNGQKCSSLSFRKATILDDFLTKKVSIMKMVLTSLN
jgi:hypothetical protein